MKPEIIIALIGSSVIAALVSTIIGGIFEIRRAKLEARLAKEIEDYKADLSKQQTRFPSAYEQQATNYKASLEAIAFKQQTRFLKLHERQAEVIAEFYKRLARAQYWVESMGSIIANKDGLSVQERTEIAAKESNALGEYFSENRLYFDESICIKIDNLLKVLGETFMDFRVASFEPKTHQERWKAAQIKMHISFPEIKQAIEKDFRVMLGYEVDRGGS